MRVTATYKEGLSSSVPAVQQNTWYLPTPSPLVCMGQLGARCRCVTLFYFIFGFSDYEFISGAVIKQKLVSLESLLLGICRKMGLDPETIEGYVPLRSD